ncbi:hypothetical protein L2750_07680 [Shewanella submarina]|uniref:RHS repeat domain-containing protein n=1 Tax=Shewanella submarina TaxID=2016376 RepID=A0ABV7G8D4_9GAMM|nr:hypothetical protein [Shewanella submarina]MCL1037031.1 hypothetical protein [Shewanella submarina]
MISSFSHKMTILIMTVVTSGVAIGSDFYSKSLSDSQFNSSPKTVGSVTSSGTGGLEPDLSYPQLEVKNYGYNFLEANNIKPVLPTLTTDLMGDRIDYFTGSVSFEHTDISIPGNSNLPVNITRNMGDPDSWHRGTREFGNWSLSIPYVKSTYITDKQGDYKTAYWPNGTACSSKLNSNPRFTVYVNGSYDTIGWSYSADGDDYWNGDTVVIPGKGSTKFTDKGDDFTRYNNRSWPVRCYVTPHGYEGFVITSDDGTVYKFGQIRNVESIKPFNLIAASPTVLCGGSLSPCSPETVSIPGDSPAKAQYKMIHTFMMVTEVSDIHGNWVKYEYHTDGRLKKVFSNDNREITLSYNELNYIKDVTANGKTWKYYYDFNSLPTLERVALPDDTFWEFRHNKSTTGERGIWTRGYHLISAQTPVGGLGCIETSAQEYISIIHPQGAKGTFTTQRVCHGSAEVPRIRKFNSQRRSYDTYFIETEKQLHSLVSKSIITKRNGYSWSYQYSRKKGVFKEEQPSAVTRFETDIQGIDTAYYNRTIVISPDNSLRKIYFNRRHGYEFGNMEYELTYSPEGDLLRSVAFDYEDGHYHGSTLEEITVDATPDDFAIEDLYEGWGASKKQRETSIVTTLIDGVSRSTYGQYYSDFNSYDHHRTTKFSGVSGTRYFHVTLNHNHDKGILNLPGKYYASSSLNFTDNYKEIRYKENTDLPSIIEVFGQTQKQNDYNGDGTLKKITYYGSNRYEQFEDYYRGKARKITVPCPTTNGCDTTNDSTSNTLVAKLEVNPDGTTKSVTDFKGNKTSYTYNPIGWLKSTDYADPRWTDELIDYSSVTTDGDGISGSGIKVGQLKQTITQGNFESTIYHDDLLRSVFTRTRDKTDASTISYQRKEFDHENRLTLRSFPSRAASSRLGMATEYDALGRAKTVTRTSDNALTSHEYLAGNKIKVTDPEGNEVTTTFLAYGQPAYDKPTLIKAPDTDDTRISYNLFDQIESISQGSVTERRYYDEKQQLCKTVRPETGITAYGYNAQRQPIWRALGTNGSTNSCDASAVPASHKTVLGYDNLGLLHTESFPDDTPDKTYRYDGNGNLTRLQSGGLVWNYEYNSLDAIEKETLAVDGKQFVLDWGYNSLGAVSSLKYPSGHTVDFAPNALGQPTRAGNYASSVNYHPNGQLSGFTYGNGIVRNITLDTTGRIDAITDSKGVNLISLDPSYDGNDNLAGLIDWVDRRNDIDTLTYDGMNRLLTANGRWGTGSYSYDGLGNIETRNLNGSIITYHYNDALNRLDRLSGAYAYGYQYDGRGNVTHNGRYSLDYNLGQQMTAAKGIGYHYDGHNRRVRKAENGEHSYSVYGQGGQLLYRLSDDGTQTDSIYLGKTIVAEVDRK